MNVFISRMCLLGICLIIGICLLRICLHELRKQHRKYSAQRHNVVAVACRNNFLKTMIHNDNIRKNVLFFFKASSWTGLTYSAMFAQRREGRWQKPVEEIMQKRGVALPLQKSRECVDPGYYEWFPAQLRWFHEDHSTSTDCGRLEKEQVMKCPVLPCDAAAEASRSKWCKSEKLNRRDNIQTLHFHIEVI